MNVNGCREKEETRVTFVTFVFKIQHQIAQAGFGVHQPLDLFFGLEQPPEGGREPTLAAHHLAGQVA
jgi:hypothetical protein